VGLDRGPLSFLSTIEELFERKSSVSGLENRDYGHREIRRDDYDTPLYTQKLALASPMSGCHSVGIVRSWTKATELLLLLLLLYTVGRIPRTGDRSDARPLSTHMTTQAE
jgi:hypothetical protein